MRKSDKSRDTIYEKSITGFQKSNEFNPDHWATSKNVNSFNKTKKINNYTLKSSMRLNNCINKRGFMFCSTKKSTKNQNPNYYSPEKESFLNSEQESTNIDLESTEKRRNCINDIQNDLEFFLGANSSVLTNNQQNN